MASQRKRIDWTEVALNLVLVALGLSIPGAFVVACIEHGRAREGWERVDGRVWRLAVEGGWLYRPDFTCPATFVPSGKGATHGS